MHLVTQLRIGAPKTGQYEHHLRERRVLPESNPKMLVFIEMWGISPKTEE